MTTFMYALVSSSITKASKGKKTSAIKIANQICEKKKVACKSWSRYHNQIKNTSSIQ